MTHEYLIIAKLGGTIEVPHDIELAKEMFEQLQDHNIIFYSLSMMHQTLTSRAVIIARMPLSLDYGGYKYKMKKGDTVFLEIENE